MSYDLTGQKVSFTYGRVVQVVSGSYYDGFGNVLPIGTSSVVVTASTAAFATTGSNIFIGNQTISGSLIVTNGITGSLQGTSSYSLNTISASYALTASYASNAEVATNVSGGTVNVSNITASNISASIISASSYYGVNGTFTSITSSGPISISGSNAYIQLLPVGDVAIPTNKTASYIYVSGSTNDLYFTQYNGDFTNTTRLRWIEGNMYTGLLHGGLITSATGSTTFNLSSGSGIIVKLNASVTTDPYPTIKFINWDNFTSQSLTYRTSSIQTFIGINESGSIVQQPVAFNDGDYNNFITIGTVIHQNYSTVNASITYPNVAYGYKQRTYDFIKAFGGLKLSGYELAVSASSTGSLTIGAGNAWADGRNYQNNPNSPSYITDGGTSVSKIFRYHVSASVDYQDTNLGAGYGSIDPTQYNNNGVLTTVTGNNVNNYRWTIQRVFWYPNSATKGIVVYYGSAEYLTEADAIANISYEKFVETQNTKANAIFIGWIIARKDCNFTNGSTFKILQGGLFRSVGGSGGGGSVNLTLAGLSDVLLTNTQDKELLVYDSSSAKWINTQNITASLYGTASNSVSSSYATTASYALNGGGGGTTLITGSTYPITSSWSNNTISASYALTSSYATTASYALNSLTASYCLNPFPISGSLGYWGSFWDTTTQNNASSSNKMLLNTTDVDSNGVYIESGSRIKFVHDGIYNLQFSAVFTSDNASSNDVNVWFNKNNQVLVDSNTVLTIAGQSNAVAAWNYVLKLQSNDYVELYWNSTEPTVKIEYLPSQSAAIPATPSLIVTATQVTNTQIAASASYAATASYFSGSVSNAISSSYSLSSSYAPTNTNITASWSTNSLTASSINFTASNSIYAQTSSYVVNAQSSSYYGGSVTSASYALSASYAPINTNITSSWSNNSLTASYVVNAQSASYYNGTVISASYSTTSSYSANSNSASYSLSSSYAPTNTNITASWSLNSITSSYVILAQSASYYGGNVTSASYASSSSYSLSSSYAPTNTNITASWSTNSLTASSINFTASNAILSRTASYYSGSVISSSYATSASYAPTNANLTASYAILASVSSSLNFTDDVAAAAGGVPLGGLYRNGNFILIRLS